MKERHKLFKTGTVKCKYKNYTYTIQYIKGSGLALEKISSHRIIGMNDFIEYCGCVPVILDKRVDEYEVYVPTELIERECSQW